MSVNQTLLSRINKMIHMPLFSPLTGQPKSMAIITPAIPSQWIFYGYIIAGVIIIIKNAPFRKRHLAASGGKSLLPLKGEPEESVHAFAPCREHGVFIG